MKKKLKEQYIGLLGFEELPERRKIKPVGEYTVYFGENVNTSEYLVLGIVWFVSTVVVFFTLIWGITTLGRLL